MDPDTISAAAPLEDATPNPPDILNSEQTVARLRGLGMKISRESLRLGLQQRVFPFGDCIVTDKSPIVFVYRILLEKWIRKRFHQ